MKIINRRIFEGRNIYSHKKCIRLDVDLEGYCETPTKDIQNFNENLLKIVPELHTHRCGIDEEGGFVKRLNEGTYLAHVCEHMIIAIHNTLGLDIAYGKAREIHGDFYYIIYQYELKNTAISIGALAIDIVNSLIAQKSINYDEKIEYIKNIMREEMVGPSTKAICEAAKEAGLPVMRLGKSGGIYQLGYGKMARVIGATIGHYTRCMGVDISCDKLLTKEILDDQWIPVAEGEKVFNTIQLLQAAEKIGYPVVLKPQFGNKGNGVIVNISNEKELLKGYKELSSSCKDIILEKYILGKDYRVCVVGHKVVAVSLRIPPHVVGNGKDTIEQLIKIINEDSRRGEEHEKPLTKIKVDSNLKNNLKKQGVDLSTILEKGKEIILRQNANLSTGGYAEDCTDIISEENRILCERVSKVIGLDVCGIDLCTQDITKSLKEDGVVMEVNAAPGIRMHHFPSCGTKRNVAKAILKTMYKDQIKNIPVVSVTGTNGKTTTTRLISYVMSLMGYKVGMTTTDGITVGNECIDKGDDTGLESAKSVLTNPDVEIAVLETARGGIIKRGLAYDLADVGVITNITEDHLGLDEVNSLDDLAHIKSLIVEAVKPEGYAVLNGDDEYSMKILDRVNPKKIIFSRNPNNKFMRENIANGNPGVYIEDNTMFVENNDKKYKICNLNEIPLTLNGKLVYNIYNALAACSALVGLDVDYCMIGLGFKKFKQNEEDNCGRFNKFNVNGVNVILDYGHNIEGYKAIIESLRLMEYKNITAVIGVPGDRTNDSMIKIGNLSGEFFDNIIIKEDEDKRGREEGEVAQLLLKGVNKSGVKNTSVEVILDEGEAFLKALLKSKPGDTIIVFFENYQKLINIINKKKKDFDNIEEVAEI